MKRLSHGSPIAAAVAVALVASFLSACAPPPPTSGAVETASYWLDGNGANLKAATPFARPVTGFQPIPDASAGLPPSIDPSVAPPRPRGIGKVYFVGSDDLPYWCAGIVVTSPNRNVVATSASCASDRDHVAFVPGSGNYNSEVSVYVAKTVVSHYDWEVYEDSDYEVSFIAVHHGVRDFGPLGLGSTGGLPSGSQGIAFGTPTGAAVQVRGFSTSWPIDPWLDLVTNDGGFDQTFDGHAAAIKGEELQGVRSSNPFATSIGSAWLTDFDATTRTGVLTGLTIATRPDAAGVAVSISARFNVETQAVFNAAAAVPSESAI